MSRLDEHTLAIIWESNVVQDEVDELQKSHPALTTDELQGFVTIVAQRTRMETT